MLNATTVVFLLALAVLGSTVALLAAFRWGQMSEENRHADYVKSLTHLYKPNGRNRP